MSSNAAAAPLNTPVSLQTVEMKADADVIDIRTQKPLEQPKKNGIGSSLKNIWSKHKGKLATGAASFGVTFGVRAAGTALGYSAAAGLIVGGISGVRTYQREKKAYEKKLQEGSITEPFNRRAALRKAGVTFAFGAAGTAIGVNLENIAPDGFFERALNFIQSIFDPIFSLGQSVAPTKKIIPLELPELVPEPIVTEVIPEAAPIDELQPLDLSELKPAERIMFLLGDLDKSGWTDRAKEDLAAAMEGKSWGIQNMAHYIANGLEGTAGLTSEHIELATQIAEIGADNNNPQSIKFMMELQDMGYSVDEKYAERIETMRAEIAAASAVDCHLEKSGSGLDITCKNAFDLIQPGESLEIAVKGGENLNIQYNSDGPITVANFVGNNILPAIESEKLSF